MIDKRLEEIRARNETYQTMRTKLSSELKNRTTLYQNGTNIEFLLDLVDALQAKLDACAKLPPAWQEDRWSTAVDARLVVKAHAAGLEAVLNG